MKKNIRAIITAFVVMILLSGCSKNITVSKTEDQRDTLVQFSTIESLLAGNYDGFESISTLKENGDIGIGTFDELDGELVMIDQKVYKIKDTGNTEEVNNTIKTPFAAVTYFDKDISKQLMNIGNYDSLKQELDKLITNRNLFYAFRVDGTFQNTKVRSVPKQKKPYPILSEVTKDQPTFEYQNIKGSLVGFWCPEYVGGINVPGYHLHFISEDRTKGGHLLDISFEKADVSADVTNTFSMDLSQSNVAGQINNVTTEIEKVEK